jgi:PrcB C-terminal
LVAAALLLVAVVPDRRSRPIDWRDFTGEVRAVPTTDSTKRLFQTRAQYQQFFGTGTEPPVDFSRRQLLLVAPGPRSSTGYSVQVLSVTERDDKITVKVKEKTPTLADHVEPEVTYPYRLLSLPTGKAVFVDWVGR